MLAFPIQYALGLIRRIPSRTTASEHQLQPTKTIVFRVKLSLSLSFIHYALFCFSEWTTGCYLVSIIQLKYLFKCNNWLKINVVPLLCHCGIMGDFIELRQHKYTNTNTIHATTCVWIYSFRGDRKFFQLRDHFKSLTKVGKGHLIDLLDFIYGVNEHEMWSKSWNTHTNTHTQCLFRNCLTAIKNAPRIFFEKFHSRVLLSSSAVISTWLALLLLPIWSMFMFH